MREITFATAAFVIVSIFSTPTAKAQSQPDTSWCVRLQSRLPGITEACRRSGFSPSGAVSVRGIPIFVKHIPTGVKRTVGSKRPVRVLLLGGIHGDELTSSAIVFRWMDSLARYAAQGFDWHVAPVVNPDGVLARPPSRTNANGVDLNRNFPMPEWQRARDYWVQTGKDPRRYPGSGPLSEPESRWVNDEITRVKPDVIVSIHAPYALIDFDGPSPPLPPRKLGNLLLRRIGVYPGSLGNYGGVINGIPVLTVELPDARTLPPDAEIQRILADLVTWIHRAATPSAQGISQS